MKKLLLCLIAAMLVATAQASLIAEYGFNGSTIPLNEVTGNSGSVYAAMYSVEDDPHGIAGNTSLKCGTTAGDVGISFLADGEQNILGNGDNDYAFTFWFKPTAEILANTGTFLTIGDLDYGHRFGVNASGNLAYRLGDYYEGSSTKSLVADKWYHIGVTFDHAAGGGLGTLNVYIDGASDNSAWVYAGTFNAGTYGGKVGQTYNGSMTGITSDRSWASLVDDLRVYDTGIGIAQVQYDMATPVPEPATMVIMGLGSFTVLLSRRKM